MSRYDDESHWPKTVEEFISQQEAMPKDKYKIPAVTSTTLAALKKLFLDPNSNVSEIAKIIIKETIKHNEERNVRNCVSPTVWMTFAEAIQQLGYVDKMVQLFVEIAKIPEYTSEEEGGEGYDYGNFLFPFNQVWTEYYRGWDDSPSTDLDREVNRQGWINFNLFNAEISRHRKEYPELDQRNRVWWMKWVLETNRWDADYDEVACWKDKPDRRYLLWTKEAHDVKTLNGYVPAAAVWFTTDAQAIYELKGNVGNEWRTDWHKKQGGKDGHSRERFIYWRKRFEWISGVEELEERTKVAAKEAAEAMRKVEEENKTN